MTPLANAKLTWKNTSSRNRKGKLKCILATYFPQAKECIDAQSLYDAAEEFFGALSFFLFGVLVFIYATTVYRFTSYCS